MNATRYLCAAMAVAYWASTSNAAAQARPSGAEQDGLDGNQYSIDEYDFGYDPGTAQTRQALFGGEVADPYRPASLTPVGISATLGAGVSGFTAEEARSYSDIGGGWDLRLVLGTRTIIGAEIAYLGSVRNVSALGLDSDAFLLSHGTELAGRLHLLPGLIQPYLLAGAGFARYMITNEDSNTSSLEDADSVVHFPLGVGAALRYQGVVADARGVLRPAISGDLFSEDATMHTWGASLSVGTEF